MMRIKMEQVGRVAKKGCGVLVSILPVILSQLPVKDIYETIRYSGDVGYDDAIDAIVKNTMFDSYKAQAIKLVKKEQSPEYYRAIIKVAKNSTFDSYLVETIKGINGDN